jgi:hypothetical protein
MKVQISGGVSTLFGPFFGQLANLLKIVEPGCCLDPFLMH